MTLSAGPGPGDIAVGDLDGDGFLDLAVSSIQPSTLSVLFGQGNRTFAPPVNVGAGLSGFVSTVALGDLNGDNRLDIAVVNGIQVELLLNQGFGSFSTPVTYAAMTGAPSSVTIVDLDGNGSLDVAIGQAFSAVIGTRLGNGDGTLGVEVGYPAAEGPVYLAFGDFSGDSLVDIAASTFGGSLNPGNLAVLNHQGPNVQFLGAGTAGCGGAQSLTSSIARVNTPGFTLSAGGQMPSSLGLCIITDAVNASGSDLLGLGIALYVDLLSSSEVLALDVVSLTFDTAQVVTSIPNDPNILGKTYAAQMVWQWDGTTQCALPQTDPLTPNWLNLSTSNGLAITILP
jgi:hypothetical protein